MPAPVNQPSIVLNIVLPENINNKHVEALKELMKRPSPTPPEAAKVTPELEYKLEKKIKEFMKKHYPTAAQDLHRLASLLQYPWKGIAALSMVAGAALLMFGLPYTLVVLCSSLSVTALLQSQALIFLSFGSLLYLFGKDILYGHDLNTILGNLLYFPVPFLLFKK